jgi:hypothetical protein
MPSAPQTRRAIINDIQLLKGDCEGLVIYDCGSGWGGLCAKLSRAFQNAKITGFEISPVPYAISKCNPLRQYVIQRADFFILDFSNADILIFYLSPYHMNKLSQKLSAECKSGTVIYSQGFPIDGWHIDKKIATKYAIEKTLYRYVI